MGERDQAAGKATAIGGLSIVLWGMMAGFERLTSQTFGPQLALVAIYAVAVPLTFILYRPERPSAFDRRYLIVSGLLFAGTDILTGMGLGLASSPEQAVQVSIVNYLWPTMTVLANLAFNRQGHASSLIVPGTILATLGVAMVVGGDAGLDLGSIAANVGSNPLPFACALGDATCWTTYSVVTPRLSRGKDALPYFFLATFLGACGLLLVTTLVAGPQLPTAPLTLLSMAPAAATALVVSLGYCCWNIGILKGSLGTLSILSYLTPVCSGIASCIILRLALAPSFFVGIALVVAGSLVSVVATRRG